MTCRTRLRPSGLGAAAFSRLARAEAGGTDQNRTDDLRIANETLSQLSYGPTELGQTGGNMRTGRPPVKANPDRFRSRRGRQKPHCFKLLAGPWQWLRQGAGSLASRP